jgi:hypothetical protein
MRRLPAVLGLLLLSLPVLAIPPGYRYIGSRVVSEGRHMYWYWDPDFYQVDASGGSMIARMYARNLELNQERPFVALIQCESRTFRRLDSKDPFDPIEAGDPIFEVWRAACDGARVVSPAVRMDRLNSGGTATSGDPNASSVAAPSMSPVAASRQSLPVATPMAAASATTGNISVAAAAPANRNDERRVDSCIRFTDNTVSQFGDAAITNTCKFPVEVVYCYKGGRGGAFDCPSPPRGMRADSLGPGATHQLPEYRRASNAGVTLVACKGTLGAVFPMLNADGGKTGCS